MQLSCYGSAQRWSWKRRREDVRLAVPSVVLRLHPDARGLPLPRPRRSRRLPGLPSAPSAPPPTAAHCRPGQGGEVEQQNRFRPPQYRPLRPGQTQHRVTPPQRINPNIPDNSNLSPEVFLPPVAENNPNFQTIFPNPDPANRPSINPYFPPNVPNYFPNQYQPPPQPGASSSTSTSTSTKKGHCCRQEL